MELNKNYIIRPYHFRLEKHNDKYQLYYSFINNLSESKIEEDKMEFEPKQYRHIKSKIDKIIKFKKPKNLRDLKKELEPVENKEEIEELVDFDGNFKSSKIPPLDWRLTPRKTTDQTVPAATIPNNPITRGYRKYYGESEEEEIALSEIDYSDAFGYEETKDMDGKKTYNFLIKNMGMEPKESKNRTKQFGKDPSGKKTKNTPKNIKNRKGFIDRMTLFEREKDAMRNLVDEILLGKKTYEPELTEKEKKVPVIIKKNIETLKKMAQKQGITINDLVKLFKSE